MSAFSFINASTKKQPKQNLSASLADDFFSDQFASFVNQSPPKSPTQRNAPMHNAQSSSVTPPLKKSAFAFISDPSSSVSKPVEKETIKAKQKQSEISQLSAETTWKRIQAEKNREMDNLKRCYHKRVLTHEQMSQLQAQVMLLKTKGIEALDVEDYLQAQTLQTQQDKLTEKLWDVFSNVEDQIEQQIHASWMALAEVLLREVEAAQKLANACKKTKDARERQFLKYHIDNERKHEEMLQQINQQRGKIDQEKSEIAFEVEMWEQADMELKNKMDESVYKEKKKKLDLTRKMKTVQDEIDALMTRLGELQQTRDEYESQVYQLDIDINEKNRQYLPEKNALESDYCAVQQRQQAVEKQSAQLDQQDEKLFCDMERLTKEEMKEKKDMETLDEQIKLATQQLEHGQEEHDAIVDAFNEYVQRRDMLVSEKRQAMIRAHLEVDARINKLEVVRRQVYAAQCQLEEQKEVVLQLTSQLTRLERQKKLAVETKQLSLAAEAASQIKSINAKLMSSESIRADRQQAVEESLGQLNDEEQQIEMLKKECSDIQQKSVTEILEIFQRSKESLQRLKQLTPSLQLLVELETESIDARIQSMQNTNEVVDNLVSIDDDPPLPSA